MKASSLGAEGLTVPDAVIALCLIGLLMGVVVPKYYRVAREAQESATRAELSNIRSSIALFKMLNNRLPQSLQELMERKVMLPGRTGADQYSASFFTMEYLVPHTVDAEKNILDPFDNAYRYDPKGGEVRSTTKGYEAW